MNHISGVLFQGFYGALLELTVTLPLGAGAPKGENFTCNVIDNFHGLFSVESVTVNLQ